VFHPTVHLGLRSRQARTFDPARLPGGLPMTHVVKTGYMPCSGVVLVHANRRFTCTSPDCHVPDFWRSVLDAHELFVPCGEALGSACPICSDPYLPNVEPSHSSTRPTDSALDGWFEALGMPSPMARRHVP